MTDALKDAVQKARDQLLALHKQLVDEQRQQYERTHGRIENPGRLLHLVTSDETFAWLRPISALIVSLDELLELETVTELDAAATRFEIDSLLNAGSPSGDRYFAMLQGSPDLVVAHGQLQQRLAQLPASAAHAIDALREARARWDSRG